MAKIGRNQPCPCGSGKKYKRCHGDPLHPKLHLPTQAMSQAARKAMRRHEAEELVRVQQQGEGKPIISTMFQDHRFVAVGSKLYYSKQWKFFADFLGDYMKMIFGTEWGDDELKKEWDERHPILRWYHDFCLAQQASKKHSDGTYSSIPTGVVHCYLGLAYGLYLLSHNVELQARLIERLKNIGNFQGAYYEVIVASCLIHAGFELALEDETDESEKHCEFSAVSKKTGKRYWVEAKMGSVAGILGKTKVDGSSPTAKPNSRVTKHLREALRKPARDERLIFIDVNAPAPSHEDVVNQQVPTWMEATIRQLDAKEKELKDGEQAYLFITNLPFHRHLEVEQPAKTALAYGLGIPDFSKPGKYGLSQAWKNKQKHIDGYNIMSALEKYPHIPSTFDGSLPLDPEDGHSRLLIGERYFFEDIGEGGVVAEVTSATVSEADKKMFIAIHTVDGEGHVITREMSDRELEVYQAHKEGYFGIVQPVGKKIKDPVELFEWIMESYKDTPREKLLALCDGHPNLSELGELDDTEIRLALCESWTTAAVRSSGLEKDVALEGEM